MANQAAQVDPGTALQAALRWSWSIPGQYVRLQSAIEDALSRQSDSDQRKLYAAEHQRPFLQVSTETHLLLVAAHHLEVATELLQLEPPPYDTELARLLRNIQEHWNDVSGSSIIKFQAIYGDPNSTDAQARTKASRLRWSDSDVIYIGGLGLAEISDWAGKVYRELTDTTSH